MSRARLHRYPVALVATALLFGAGCHRLAHERLATLPAGTNLVIRLEDGLDSGRNRDGDVVLGQTAEALFVGDAMVVPEGTTVRGSLSEVQGAGRVKGRASMTIRFQEIDIETRQHAIDAEPLRLVGESGTRGDLEKLAAGGVIGGIVGAVAGGGKGAAIGGAIGLGAGTAVVLATKGKEIQLSPGQKVVVRLEHPVELPVQPRSASQG